MTTTATFTILISPPVSSQPSEPSSPTQDASQARLGRLTVRNGSSLLTPSLLVHTGKGCSPNVTWDVLERVVEEENAAGSDSDSVNDDDDDDDDANGARERAPLACQVDVLQLVHQQDNLRALQKHAYSSSSSFLGVPSSAVVFATPRNPVAYEHVGMTRNSTDSQASFMTFRGASVVTPEAYVELACGLGADVLVLLGDEVMSDARVNRLVESSKRTIAWAGRGLDVLKTRGDEVADGVFVLCPIVGGADLCQREDAVRYIRSVVEDRRVGGVYVSGLGTGEGAGARLGVLKAVVRGVPADKLRMTSGVSNPVEVLEAVRCGVDVFDTAYVEMVTRAGLALCFPTRVDGLRTGGMGDGRDGRDGRDGMKINLWSDGYRLDRSPMVAGCRCGSCREHTRGYVHHLLVTHEMTAWVLLEQHNVYHMLRFFRAVRRAIREGVFEEFYEAFVGYARTWQR